MDYIIDNKRIKVHLWDTAGQEKYQCIIRSYFREICGVILMFDVSNEKSFNDLKRWGTAKTVLTGLGRNFQDHNYLYPIPQRDIDKSGGTITQNAGY